MLPLVRSLHAPPESCMVSLSTPVPSCSQKLMQLSESGSLNCRQCVSVCPALARLLLAMFSYVTVTVKGIRHFKEGGGLLDGRLAGG